jgi:hypothetical protein
MRLYSALRYSQIVRDDFIGHATLEQIEYYFLARRQ